MRKWTLIVLLAPAWSWATALPHVAHSHISGTIAAGSTRYIAPGNGVITDFDTEAHAQIPFYTSATITGLYVRMNANGVTGTSTFTLRINGVSANLKVNFAGGVTGISSNTTTSDRINWGDKLDIMVEVGSGGTTIQPIAIMFLLNPIKAENYQRMNNVAISAPTSIGNGWQPYYEVIQGAGGNNLTESRVTYVMRSSGTFRNMAVYVSTNARASTIDFTFRKNLAATAMKVSVSTKTWGLFENKTNTVNVVAGDTVTWEVGMVDGSDTAAIAYSYISAEFVGYGNDVEYPVAMAEKPQNAGETWQIPFLSALTFGGDEYRMPAYTRGTLDRFCMYTPQNNCSTNSTVKIVKNGTTDPDMVITIPANTTGLFCDNTHSITFLSTDTLSYVGNSPAGTGTMYYTSIGARLTVRGPSDPLGSLQIFPTNNIWNTRIDNAVLHSSSALWMDETNGHTAHELHPDFGNTYLGKWNGIPYMIIDNDIPNATVTWPTDYDYSDESEPLPSTGLRIPDDAICESDPAPLDPDSDRHCILVNTDENKLYEVFASSRIYQNGVWLSSWTIRQLSIWDLTSNALRTDGWTSADAAGLPILPGLVRWEEVQSGRIDHALRFTLALTYSPYMWPARHNAITGTALNPPFGMRVRLKSNFDISGFSATNQVILTALKEYGMFLADNGGDWFISGAPSPHWDNDDLGLLETIIPRDSFEVVDTSTWLVNADSGEANPPSSNSITGNSTLRGGGRLFR